MPQTDTYKLERNCYNKESFVASNFRRKDIISVRDDGCFAFVDVGDSVQRLKCLHDHLSIYTQGHVGLDQELDGY